MIRMIRVIDYYDFSLRWAGLCPFSPSLEPIIYSNIELDYIFHVQGSDSWQSISCLVGFYGVLLLIAFQHVCTVNVHNGPGQENQSTIQYEMIAHQPDDYFFPPEI